MSHASPLIQEDILSYLEQHETRSYYDSLPAVVLMTVRAL